VTSILALNGGTPVRNSMLKYAAQSVDESDRIAVDNVLRSDWLTTGPAVADFEEALCCYTGAEYAVVVNTGTAALHAAVYAAGISEGDEVIVPAISFVASANCILYQRGTPVFCDLNSDTLNIDPEDVEKKITSRTRAIIAVDFAGHPCDHDALKALADKHGIPVIEDAAHSLGAALSGRQVGTLQQFTTLSFHPVKHITTGEGGAILTDNYEIAKTMRSFRHHGIDLDLHTRGQANSWAYDVLTLGFNYRIPDINCALGQSQLAKLNGWLVRRREIVAEYEKLLKDLPMLQLPKERKGSTSSWHLYIVRLNLETLTVPREKVFSALRAENIGVNVHYIPIPWMTHYANLGYLRGQWPVAEGEYERVLTLPLYPAMSNQDVADVVEALYKVWKIYKR